jgi:acyl carrier protein
MIASMEASGVKILQLKGDVARAADVEAALAEVERKMPPIAGIVHAAGVVDDRTLVDMSEEQFSRVLAPKILGAFNLHALTADRRLDFFIMYSSSSALLGAPGQGNYAAANAFLDGLAHARRRLGLAGMSIQWGPFSEVGLAAAADIRGKRLAHRGVDSLSPAQGLVALARLLERPRAEVAVVRLAVHQWIEFYPQLAGVPFWSELQKDQPAERPASSRGISLRQLLEKRPPTERLGLLERHILEQVGQVLRLDVARIDRLSSFTSLGMDSLLSLELRNRLESSLGVRLTSTLLFTYPNPASLADHLLDRMNMMPGRRSQPPSIVPKPMPNEPTIPTRRTDPLPAAPAQTVRVLSQAEAEALLEEELSRSEDYLS